MIAVGDKVRTMTGKTGVVLATRVSTDDGPRVQVCIGPLTLRYHNGDDAAVIPALTVFYHPDDLTNVSWEAPPCSNPSM